MGIYWVLTDFSGQENVNLAHYLKPIDNGNLENVIENGSKDNSTDLHSLNAIACGVSRSDSKAIFFGLLYGSSATLTGFTILGDKLYTDYTQDEFDKMFKKLSKRTIELEGTKYYPIKKGQLVLFNDKLIIQAIFGLHVQTKLRKNTKGLEKLEEQFKQEAKTNGYVELPLGRKIYIDSDHKALNYFNQGLGGLAFKVYLRIFYNTLYNKGIYINEHYRLQACIYDEIDIIADPNHVDTIVQVMNDTYELTSKELALNVRYTGETLKGVDWDSCH